MGSGPRRLGFRNVSAIDKTSTIHKLGQPTLKQAEQNFE